MSHQVMSVHEPPAHPKETSVLLESLIEGTKKGKAFVRYRQGKRPIGWKLTRRPHPSVTSMLDASHLMIASFKAIGSGIRTTNACPLDS
ncbi:MAG: hypothetical protein D6690_08215 [Nitrospirae bacterium]|nr:MAG: hypothetical protein D6690_08215 [Nitrospirota bacterium]